MDAHFKAAVDKCEKVLKGEDAGADFFRSQMTHRDEQMISTLLRFRGLTRAGFEKKHGMSLEDAGYKVRSIPTATGWGQGIIIGLGNEESVEIQLCVQHGYGLDKLLLQSDKCGHGEQGKLSFDHTKASDAAHSEFVTMAINAPTEEDNLWKATLRKQIFA